MAYNQHTWVDGELITDDKLNNMEQGIADASSGGDVSASASIDQTSSNPSVKVTRTETASGVNFDFAFAGVKGEAGDPGAAGAAGTAAGFGVLGASASQLEEGSAPTASVTASGEDTAKVFDFAFGVPKGDTGPQGSAGASVPTVVSWNLQVSGSSVTGTITFSEGDPVTVSGTYHGGSTSGVVGTAAVNQAVVGRS